MYSVHTHTHCVYCSTSRFNESTNSPNAAIVAVVMIGAVWKTKKLKQLKTGTRKDKEKPRKIKANTQNYTHDHTQFQWEPMSRHKKKL